MKLHFLCFVRRDWHASHSAGRSHMQLELPRQRAGIPLGAKKHFRVFLSCFEEVSSGLLVAVRLLLLVEGGT